MTDNITITCNEIVLDNLQLEPKVYQTEGAQHLAHAKRAILADEMGTGKTGQAYMAWRSVGMPGPCVIIARPNAQATWMIQAPMWGVQTPLVIQGTQKQRAKDWAEVDKTSLVATSVESFRSDRDRGVLPRQFGCIIYDEYQRALINRKNKAVNLFRATKGVPTEYLFLLSGSPTRKGFQDLWTALNICDHKQFSSYWRFVQAFGHMQLNEFGAWEILGLKERDLLARRIAPWFLRREKKDILPYLPKKTRILDRLISMTPQQQKLYNQLLNELIMELPNDDIIVARNELTKLTRLRQLLVTPKIFDSDFPEYGGCIEYLGELLEETDDHHFVVFTPFTKAIPHIESFLRRKSPTSAIITLQGGLKAEDVIQRINLFREREGIAICSVQYAESFELTPAKWAYFCGYSWSLIDNIQAEDRLHRMHTQFPITYYYPNHSQGVDKELMLPILEERATQITHIYQSSRLFRQRLINSLVNA